MILVLINEYIFQEFQNHRNQAKIDVVFYHFPSLGRNEPP